MVLPRLSGLFPFSSPTPSRTLFLLAFDSLTPFCHRLLLSSVFNPTKKITSLSAIHHVHAGSSLHFENPSLFICHHHHSSPSIPYHSIVRLFLITLLPQHDAPLSQNDISTLYPTTYAFSHPTSLSLVYRVAARRLAFCCTCS